MFASVSALLTAAVLTLGGGVAAHAQEEINAPGEVPASSNVVITKLEQPGSLGDAADGEAQDVSGYTPIAGVEYQAHLVTGTGEGGANDIGTNDGQQYAAGLESPAAADTEGTATESGTTNADGVINWTLDRGLYVVSETNTPAGVTPSDQFFLAVPLTDPNNLDSWLGTIYVYPKNSVISGDKSVIDGVNTEDGVERNYVVGGDVTWTITAGIPRNQGTEGNFAAPDAFRITDTFNDGELSLNGAPVVSIGETELTAGEHYTHTEVADGDQTTHQIDFESAGLQALATAVNADPTAEVTVQLVSTVVSSGDIQNSALVYPNQGAIDGNSPLEIDEAEIRYGSFSVQKNDNDGRGLEGAEFRVYLSEAAAVEAGDDYLTPSTNTDGIWATDVNGQLTIDGLRLSNWADGAEQAADDDLYQSYWLVEVTAPTGHQILPQPIKVDLSGDHVEEVVVNVPTRGAFALPLTGGAGTALLTALGLGILALVLVAVRRRRAQAALAQ